MLRKTVFSVLCAFIIPLILMPGERVEVTSELTCPSGLTKDDEPDTETPLEKNIFSQLLNAKRFEPLTASGDVRIRMDPESLYCYEREEEIILETFATLWWTDKLICWDPSEFDNINNVTVTFGELWMPTLISYTKSIEIFELPYQLSECTVYSNGTVTCYYILFLTGMCEMYLRDWPTASLATCWVDLEIFNPTGRQKLIHWDNRTSSEWLSSANVGNPGQFRVIYMKRETAGKGVLYAFLFKGTTEAFGHAVTAVAGVLSIALASSFALPAGSVARMSLLACVCVSLILTIGFLGDMLSSVTPDTPNIVRLHGDVLIISAVALLPATLLAPRLTPTKPYTWQLSLRSWLLSSSFGRFLLLIFRVPIPTDEGATTLGADGGHRSTAFQKENSDTSHWGGDSTRMMLFTLTDRVIGTLCCISVLGLWIAMFEVFETAVWHLSNFIGV